MTRVRIENRSGPDSKQNCAIRNETERGIGHWPTPRMSSPEPDSTAVRKGFQSERFLKIIADHVSRLAGRRSRM